MGLGLRLERSTRDPDVYIQEIVPGFAAHENGRLQLHDVVVAVDHIPLLDMDLDAVKELTIGEEGTFCTLQIKRGNHYFQVTLMRKFPDELNRQNSQALYSISDSDLASVGGRGLRSRSNSPPKSRSNTVNL